MKVKDKSMEYIGIGTLSLSGFVPKEKKRV